MWRFNMLKIEGIPHQMIHDRSILLLKWSGTQEKKCVSITYIHI